MKLWQKRGRAKIEILPRNSSANRKMAPMLFFCVAPSSMTAIGLRGWAIRTVAGRFGGTQLRRCQRPAHIRTSRWHADCQYSLAIKTVMTRSVTDGLDAGAHHAMVHHAVAHHAGAISILRITGLLLCLFGARFVALQGQNHATGDWLRSLNLEQRLSPL
jgi:hypothetical protein